MPVTQAVATQNSKTPPPAPRPASVKKDLKLGPAFWTVTGIMSLVVNVVLIAILLAVLPLLGSLNVNPLAIGSNLLGGLHTNFEKMDQAHIMTEIQVNTEIPVQFDIPINTQTNVVLSQDVSITGARVTLQTGGLEIVQAPTNIILPAGTVLPINLNLTVPVDKMVPVSLIVPVDIALNHTDRKTRRRFGQLLDLAEPLVAVEARREQHQAEGQGRQCHNAAAATVGPEQKSENVAHDEQIGQTVMADEVGDLDGDGDAVQGIAEVHPGKAAEEEAAQPVEADPQRRQQPEGERWWQGGQAVSGDNREHCDIKGHVAGKKKQRRFSRHGEGLSLRPSQH